MKKRCKHRVYDTIYLFVKEIEKQSHTTYWQQPCYSSDFLSETVEEESHHRETGPFLVLYLRNESKTHAALVTFKYLNLLCDNLEHIDDPILKCERRSVCIAPRKSVALAQFCSSLYLPLIEYNSIKLDWALMHVAMSSRCIEDVFLKKYQAHVETYFFDKFVKCSNHQPMFGITLSNMDLYPRRFEFTLQDTRKLSFGTIHKDTFIGPKESVNVVLLPVTHPSLWQVSWTLSSEISDNCSFEDCSCLMQLPTVKIYKTGDQRVTILKSQITWKLFPQYQILDSVPQATPWNTFQSPFLGNCWLVATISSLLKRDKELVTRRLKYYDKDMYTFSFFKNGCECTATVNGTIPYISPISSFVRKSINQEEKLSISELHSRKSHDTRVDSYIENQQIVLHPAEPAFLHSNSILVSLLEKAYAKICGSYFSMNGGSPITAMFDLTGHPASCHWVKNLSLSQVENLLKEAINLQYPVCISTGRFKIDLPIQSCHAYTLLDMRQINNITYFLLRDPRKLSSLNISRRDNKKKISKDATLDCSNPDCNCIDNSRFFTLTSVSNDTMHQEKINYFQGNEFFEYKGSNVVWIDTQSLYECCETIHICYFKESMKYYKSLTVEGNIRRNLFCAYEVEVAKTTRITVGVVQEDAQFYETSTFNAIGLSIFRTINNEPSNSEIKKQDTISTTSELYKPSTLELTTALDPSTLELITILHPSKVYLSFTKEFYLEPGAKYIIVPISGNCPTPTKNASKIILRSNHALEFALRKRDFFYSKYLQSSLWLIHIATSFGTIASEKTIYFNDIALGQLFIYEYYGSDSIVITCSFQTQIYACSHAWPLQNDEDVEGIQTKPRRESMKSMKFMKSMLYDESVRSIKPVESMESIESVEYKKSRETYSMPSTLLLRPQMTYSNIQVRHSPQFLSFNLQETSVKVAFHGNVTIEESHQYKFSYAYKLKQ